MSRKTFVVCCIVLLLCIAAAVGAFSYKQAEAELIPTYNYTGAERPTAGIILRAKDYTKNDQANIDAPAELDGREGVLQWNEGGALEWEVNVPADGSYGISLGYEPMAGHGRSIEYLLYIDGKAQSANNAPFELNRAWRDEPGPFHISDGNELRPKQMEQRMWLQTDLLVPGDSGGEPLKLQLSAGHHLVRLESVRESLTLDYILLTPSETLPSYASYHASQQAEKQPVRKITIDVSAEHAYLKSTSGLFPGTDRTSPLTKPYDPVKIRINTIGGTNWEVPGDWISWKFTVPEDGNYKIGMRYHQSEVKESFVSRKIFLDGALPFSELKAVQFPYNLGWGVKELGEDSESGFPYLFHLTKGVHEIKLEAVLGEMAAPIHETQDIVYQLNEMYRKIIMITSMKPDPYRDYNLDKSIPEIIPAFQKQIGRLQEQANTLDRLSGQKNPGSQVMQQLVRQLQSLVDRPDTIPKRLDTYKNNITGLADWLLRVKDQPLELDYLYAADPQTQRPQAEANIFQTVLHELRAFAGSFFENYDSLGNDNTATGKSIEVWTGLGRDEAYVLKRMVDESFTPATGIHVNLNLVQNSLVTATMAGKGPDVNLFTRRGEAMNLAFRGALSPLDSFSGFEALPKQYMPTAFVPYQYKNQTYGIPEEQEFFMMFYRVDVLQDLGVKPPQTWAELFKVSPILQNSNMQIGLPYQNLDATQLLNQGMGVLNLFPTLLMQNSIAVYNKALDTTRFDEPMANQAFKMWTDFYKLFDYPLYKDDLSRFRTGEMPIVITTYKLYNQLVKAAPEIAGTWRMVPIPGTVQQDGSIDRASAANGTASIILKDAKDQASAWSFVKWWNQPDVQSQFTQELENEVGIIGRRMPANTEAFASSNWSEAEQSTLSVQWKEVEEIPELPGSYYTSRNIDNAFRSVILQDENPRESLYFWNKQINDEIKRKQYEFGGDQP